jgi:hypothetical protein
MHKNIDSLNKNDAGFPPTTAGMTEGESTAQIIVDPQNIPVNLNE